MSAFECQSRAAVILIYVVILSVQGCVLLPKYMQGNNINLTLRIKCAAFFSVKIKSGVVEIERGFFFFLISE